jgi:hypothetical protein
MSFEGLVKPKQAVVRLGVGQCNFALLLVQHPRAGLTWLLEYAGHMHRQHASQKLPIRTPILTRDSAGSDEAEVTPEIERRLV